MYNVVLILMTHKSTQSSRRQYLSIYVSVIILNYIRVNILIATLQIVALSSWSYYFLVLSETQLVEYDYIFFYINIYSFL